MQASTSTPSLRVCRSSGYWHELLHGSGQDACSPSSTGPRSSSSSTRRTLNRLPCAPILRLQAGRLPSRTPSTTWAVHVSRQWVPLSATPSRSTPTRLTKPSPSRPTSPPVSPATPGSTSEEETMRYQAGRSTGAAATMWKPSQTRSHTVHREHIRGNRETRRYGQGHRIRSAQNAYRRSLGPHSGPYRLRPSDNRWYQQIPSRPRRSHRHP